MRKRLYFTYIIVFLCTFVPFDSAFSQTGSDLVTLDVSLSPTLESAQVLGLGSLGIDSKGSGPLLVSGTLTNNTDQLLEDLFFEFEINAGKVGTIVRLTQEAAYPFSLDPRQVVYGTNNNIADDRLPGIEESLRFDGGLTSEGENFVEGLNGSTTLPADIYIVQIKIFQVTNAEGKRLLASQVLELGNTGGGEVADDLSIFLRTPGDIIGTDITITNRYPQFSWEGDAANTYRVLIVESNGQDSPETLIESAKSSDPVQGPNGEALGGSLLQFENLDFLVRGNTLQYPASGAQPLETGKTYYWQITTELQTANGSEELVSDIWSFKMTNPEELTSVIELNEETRELFNSLLGSEEFSNLIAEGYTFENIEIDGQVYSGAAAVEIINQLLRKIEEGDVIINN